MCTPPHRPLHPAQHLRVGQGKALRPPAAACLWSPDPSSGCLQDRKRQLFWMAPQECFWPFHKQSQGGGGAPSLPPPVRDTMLAAALFPEFLKELAALAQNTPSSAAGCWATGRRLLVVWKSASGFLRCWCLDWMLNAKLLIDISTWRLPDSYLILGERGLQHLLSPPARLSPPCLTTVAAPLAGFLGSVFLLRWSWSLSSHSFEWERRSHPCNSQHPAITRGQ